LISTKLASIGCFQQLVPTQLCNYKKPQEDQDRKMDDSQPDDQTIALDDEDLEPLQWGW